MPIKSKNSVRRGKLPWRKIASRWTDTCFEKKLLDNPSLMTNIELATALEEHQMWRTSQGKYNWNEDPANDGWEIEPPFSAKVLTNLVIEAIARLKISGDLALGRYKK